MYTWSPATATDKACSIVAYGSFWCVPDFESSPFVATYITFPGRAVKFSPCTVMFPDSAKLSTVKLLANASFQRFAAVPNLYVFD